MTSLVYQYFMAMDYAEMSASAKARFMVHAPELDIEPPEIVVESFGGREAYDEVMIRLKAIRDLIVVEG